MKPVEQHLVKNVKGSITHYTLIQQQQIVEKNSVALNINLQSWNILPSMPETISTLCSNTNDVLLSTAIVCVIDSNGKYHEARVHNLRLLLLSLQKF